MDKQVLAIFDLDETLTIKDTYLSYLVSYLKLKPKKIFRCWKLPLDVFGFAIGIRNNSWLKEQFLRAILKGESVTEKKEDNKAFVTDLISNGLNVSAQTKLIEHQEKGHRVILLSASLDFYVTDIGEALGITEVLATKTEVKDGILTGNLGGPNLKGSKKVNIIQEYMGGDRDKYEITAYGDDESDLPLLEWVDQGYLINPTAKLKSIAGKPIKFLNW